MVRKRRASLPPLYLIITVPILSLCATFIGLYILAPSMPTLQTLALNEVESRDESDKEASIETPVKLHITSLGVEARIKPVGLTPEGDMAIDEDPAGAAWYELGPKPGEAGSAVIAGHYGWKDGVGSIFNNLSKLKSGDTISTVGDKGQNMSFVVVRTATYDPEADATEVFRSSDGKARLNLITCQGTWIGARDTYSERLVVFTELSTNENSQSTP